MKNLIFLLLLLHFMLPAVVYLGTLSVHPCLRKRRRLL
jgi:hypothetical protein